MSRRLFTHLRSRSLGESTGCCVCESESNLTMRCAYCGEVVCGTHQKKVQMNKKGIVIMCSECVSLYDSLVCTTYAG